MTPSESVELVRRLMAAFPRHQVTKETVAVYAESLADLEVTAAREAVQEAIVTLKFFPAIAEIREIAARRRSDCPDCSRAWGELMRKVGSVGRYRTPKWSHPAIAHVVDAMSWEAICDSENLEATRAHFMRLYSETATRVVREVNVRPALEAQRASGPRAIADIVKLLPGGKP